jgi:hypothetical protein
MAHHAVEQQVGGRREAHRRTGVAVAGFLDGVHGQHPYGVDRLAVEIGPIQIVFGSHVGLAPRGMVWDPF